MPKTRANRAREQLTGRYVILLHAGLLAACAGAQPADPAVRITGGPQQGSPFYRWTLENNDTSAVVEIAFTHHHANLPAFPEGWDVDCENLVNVGVVDAVGSCIARATTVEAEIAPGTKAEFSLRVQTMMVRPKPDTVTLTLADDRTLTIQGVLLPRTRSWFSQNITLIGLGTIFVGFLLLRAWSQKRNKNRADPTTPDPTP